MTLFVAYFWCDGISHLWEVLGNTLFFSLILKHATQWVSTPLRCAPPKWPLEMVQFRAPKSLDKIFGGTVTIVNYDVLYIVSIVWRGSIFTGSFPPPPAAAAPPRQALEVGFQRQISRCPCAWAADGQMSALGRKRGSPGWWPCVQKSQERMTYIGCGNSDQQDYDIFRIGDPNLNLHFPLLLGGGHTQDIHPLTNKHESYPA